MRSLRVRRAASKARSHRRKALISAMAYFSLVGLSSRIYVIEAAQFSRVASEAFDPR